MNQVRSNLHNYLDSNRVVGPEWNLTCIGRHSKTAEYDCLLDVGKYNIPNKDYDKFLELVHDAIFKNGLKCGLLERHLPHGGPILIDLDFKYESNGPLQRRFTDDMIRQFIISYIDGLFHFFDMSIIKDTNLRFFILKKDSPEVQKGKHKDGVHIHCPDLTLTPTQQYILRGYILQQNIIQTIFGRTKFINSPYNVFCVSVIHTNNWFLYGASKPYISKYLLCNIYRIPTELDINIINDDDDEKRFIALDNAIDEEIIDDYTTLEITNLLSIRYGHDKITPLILLNKYNNEWNNLNKIWGAGKDTGTDIEDIKDDEAVKQNTLNNAFNIKELTLAGQPWSKKEDEQLIKEYNIDKMTIIDICKIHKRMPGGIISRLKHGGIIAHTMDARGYIDYQQSDLYKEIRKHKKENRMKNITDFDETINNENNLKSTPVSTPFREVIDLRNEVSDIKNEISILKHDVKEILRLMNTLYDLRINNNTV